MSTESLYRTTALLHRQLRVRYPAGQGRIVLRTDLDWNTDVGPAALLFLNYSL